MKTDKDIDKLWHDIKEYEDALKRKQEELTNLIEELKPEPCTINGVSGSANEIINYIENEAEIAIPINELMHEEGRHLTKKEYGHVLLKFLVKELREHYR